MSSGDRQSMWELLESMALLAGTIVVAAGLGMLVRGLLG